MLEDSPTLIDHEEIERALDDTLVKKIKLDNS